MNDERRTPVFAVVTFCFFLPPLISGCGSGGSDGGGGGDGGDPLGGPQIPDSLDSSFSSEASGKLASTSFVFPAGSGIFEAGDPRESMTSVLTMGRLDRGRRTSAFSIATPDGSVDGGVFFGLDPCSFEFTYSKPAGAAPAVGAGVRAGGSFDQCGVDPQGRLALLSVGEGAYLVSNPGRPPGTDFHRAVALTEEAVVESPPATPTGVSGVVELTLTGQLLSFAAGIQGPAGLQDLSLTIHPGSAVDRAPAAMTLVGFSAEPLREINFNAFQSGIAAGSVLLSEAEAASIADGLAPFYIQVSSFSRPNGLLRGQINPETSNPDEPLVLTDASVASGSAAGETPGEIQVSLGGGSTAILSIPADAAGKSVTKAVVMTPVRAAVGASLTGGTLAGVRLAPDQTYFEEPLKLTFDLPGGFHPGSIVAVSVDEVSGEITYLPFPPGAVQGNAIEVAVHHFSDVLVGETDPDTTGTGLPPIPEYRHWRDRIGKVLAESADEQSLGLDSDPTAEIDLLLVRAYSETILPNINKITDKDSFDPAFLDFKYWIQDIQSYGTAANFAQSISEAGAALAERIEAVAASLEQQCLNAADACEKRGLLEEYVNWLSRAQVLEIASGAAADIPPYEQFCGALATQQGAGTRLLVEPPSLFAFPGTSYDFDVIARDANLVEYPVPQPQWSLTPAGANTLDPSTGQGVAAEAGVYEVSISDPTICADPGKSVLNVKDFSGTWDVVQRAESVSCPEDFRFQRRYQVGIVQNGDNVRITHPTFGPVDAAIIGYAATQSGGEPPGFGIDTGMVTSPATVFCAEFFQDVGIALNDQSCFPPNSCEPLSCEESYHVTGAFDEYGNTLAARNQWSDELSWNLTSPGGDPVRIDSACAGVDVLSLTRAIE